MQDTAVLEQLIDDIDIARQLLELTDLEFQALSERDLSSLEGILTRKQPLLALLGQHGSQRSQCLSSQGLSVDREGLEAFAASVAKGPEILKRSEELDDMLKACRTANERNGRLIRAGKASVDSVLGILQGNSNTPSLYNNRGGAARINQQRPLSQA